MTCGSCYHHRFGRCKNKDASTYGVAFPADSVGCQMHLTSLLLPFGFITQALVMLIGIPFIILSQMGGGDTNSSTRGSGNGGFEI